MSPAINVPHEAGGHRPEIAPPTGAYGTTLTTTEEGPDEA